MMKRDELLHLLHEEQLLLTASFLTTVYEVEVRIIIVGIYS